MRSARWPIVTESFRTLGGVNRAVVAGQRCPRLIAHCRETARLRRKAFRVWTYWGRPVPGFGDPSARLVVVGLAPAAHGANRTGRMFTGDSSGDWLFDALHRHGFANQPNGTARDDGLVLEDCYITAAARCAPPGNKPSAQELASCRRYLAADLRLLRNVRITIVLGRIAWRSWHQASAWNGQLAPGDLPFSHGGLHRLPDGRHLLCSYHPSRQNTNTGRLTRAMWYHVFATARRIVDA